METAATSQGDVARDKQHPQTHHEKTLICVSRSLRSPLPPPPVCEATALSGIYLTSTYFYSTHSDKLILELRIITGLTLWKWKEMYARWRKQARGLTILSAFQRRPIYKPHQECQRPLALPLSLPASWFSLKDPQLSRGP